MKLKKILMESNVWDRKFGEKLPTLADVTEKFKKLQEAKYTFKSKHPDNMGGTFTADKIIDDEKNGKWRVDFTRTYNQGHGTQVGKKAIYFDKSDFKKEKNLETVIKKLFKDPFSATFWEKRTYGNKKGQGGYTQGYEPKYLFTLGKNLYRKSGGD